MSESNSGFEGAPGPPWSQPRFSHEGIGAKTGAAATGMVETLKETAQEAWCNTKQGAQQVASTVSHSATDAFETTTEFIRKHPFACVCVGFCVGFALAEAMQITMSKES